MEQAVILSAVRTPIGKFQGGLAPLSAPQLGAKVVAEAVRRAGIVLAKGRVTELVKDLHIPRCTVT
jgi:acetyl-CoA C-acetyltransferase